MDHHLSWYNFIPFYDTLYTYLQNNYSYSVVFNYGLMPKVKSFETVTHIFSAFFVCIILMTISLYIRNKIKNSNKYLIPEKNITFVNFFEFFYENLLSFMKNTIGKNYEVHVPFVGSLALFIFFSNISGLIPGFSPPTNNLNTTFACGLIVFLYFNYHGFKAQGLNHIIHLANPIGAWWGWFLCPLLFPIEFVGMCVRPCSLGIRLAGNMIGDHSVLITFAGLMPLLMPLPFFFFGLMVSLIQTFVFVLLTCVYISLHTSESENH